MECDLYQKRRTRGLHCIINRVAMVGVATPHISRCQLCMELNASDPLSLDYLGHRHRFFNELI